MKGSDLRAHSWRNSVDQALAEAHMSRRSLAYSIGVSPQRVSQWLSSDNKPFSPPEPDIVFAIEDVLGVANRCSSTLGYVRVAENKENGPTVLQAIESDVSLNKTQRDMLNKMYRFLVSETDAGTSS